MFVNNCVHVAVVSWSSFGCSLVHLGLHLCHIFLHTLLNIWVFVQHIVHEGLFEFFVLNFRLEVHFIMHFRLIYHHLDHHFSLVLILLGSSAKCLHVLETQFLLLFKYLKSLLFGQFRLR